MNALWLLPALLVAAGFYLASPHQRLWPRAVAHAWTLRAAACGCAVLAAVAGIAALGMGAGLFAVLTTGMLAAVLLPYLDAWRRLRNMSRGERNDVG